MKTDTLDLRNMDCMDLMREFPDDHFELAVVDPPYGIGVSRKENPGGQTGTGKWRNVKKKIYKKGAWDDKPPPKEYFDELFRVSKDQIIWGANHLMENIARSSPSWIIWDKQNGDTKFADAELAYTSHKTSARIWVGLWNGFQRCEVVDRIHPTQKPVKLYDWIFANYAEKGMRILDTHMGSGSIAIAAHYANMHLTASELDADYYREACERVARETQQTALFDL